MRLSAKIIKTFANINVLTYGNEWIVRNGDQNTLYFQLVDLNQDGLRYMPTNATYSVSVTFPSLDSSKIITSTAVLADSLDRSIWKVTLTTSQTPASGNVQFALTEGADIKRFSVTNGIIVEYLNTGSC